MARLREGNSGTKQWRMTPWDDGVRWSGAGQEIIWSVSSSPGEGGF